MGTCSSKAADELSPREPSSGYSSHFQKDKDTSSYFLTLTTSTGVKQAVISDPFGRRTATPLRLQKIAAARAHLSQLPESIIRDVFVVQIVDESKTNTLGLFDEPHEVTIIEELAFSLDVGSLGTSAGGYKHDMFCAGNSTIASSGTGASWNTNPTDLRTEPTSTDGEADMKQQHDGSHSPRKMQKSRSTKRVDEVIETPKQEQWKRKSSSLLEDTIDELESSETTGRDNPIPAVNGRKQEHRRRRSIKVSDNTIDEMKHHDTWEIPVEAPKVTTRKQEQRRRRSSVITNKDCDDVDSTGNLSVDAIPSPPGEKEGRRISTKKNGVVAAISDMEDILDQDSQSQLVSPIDEDSEIDQVAPAGPPELESIEQPQTPAISDAVPASPTEMQVHPKSVGDADTPKTVITSNKKIGSKSPRPFGGPQHLPIYSPKPSTRRNQVNSKPSPSLLFTRGTPNTVKKQNVGRSTALAVIKATHSEDEKMLMTPLQTSSPTHPRSLRSMGSNGSCPGLPPFGSDTEDDIRLEMPSDDGPWYFQDIANPTFRRLCTKLRKKINLDPWDEFKRFDDEEFTDFVQTYPQTCRVRYDFDNFTGKLFPFSIICTMGAKEETVRATWEAFPAALLECDDWIGTPLHYACSYRAKKSVVKFLIQRDASMLEQTNPFGRTPLHMACLFKAPVQTISPLLEVYPHAVEVLDKDGYSPLHLACENGSSLQVIEALLEISPNENGIVGTNERDLTPLHIACANNAPKAVIKALIDHCPRAADYLDYDGQLPLHHAAQASAPAGIIELLIECFPRSTEIKNDRGQTAYRIAKRNHMPEKVLNLLESRDD